MEKIDTSQLVIENTALKNIIIQLQLELNKSKSFEQASKINFCECYEMWLNFQKQKIQPSTHHEYVKIYIRDIKPYFVQYLLRDVTHEQIEQFYQKKLAQGLSVHTVHRLHANLHTMFKYAARHDYIKENPFLKVQRPKDTYQYVANYYDVPQLIDLLLVSSSNKIFPIILLASLLGLRRSEILGLKWDAIDFNHNSLTVKRKLTRNKDKCRDELSNSLKNKSSYRTLPLPNLLSSYLRKLKVKQAANAQTLGYCNEYLDYICVDNHGKLPTLNSVTNGFRYVIQRNGLPKIRFHDLRHSCATMLIHLGYSMKEIQEWLGHSNYNTTAKFYTHIDMSDKFQMANRLNEVFSIIEKAL